MCTIHSRVVEDYQKDLHPGAVLVLRQVSAIATCVIARVYNKRGTDTTIKIILYLPMLR